MVKKPLNPQPRNQHRGSPSQSRNFTNIGLLMGLAAIGVLAVGLWVAMVIF